MKIIVLRNNEMQENTNRQLNNVRKTIHEQNELNKEIETIKKNETGILELNNAMTELKNSMRASAADLIVQKKELVN